MWKSIGMATSLMPRVTAIGIRQTLTTSRSGGRLFSTSTRRLNAEGMLNLFFTECLDIKVVVEKITLFLKC